MPATRPDVRDHKYPARSRRSCCCVRVLDIRVGGERADFRAERQRNAFRPLGFSSALATSPGPSLAPPGSHQCARLRSRSRARERLVHWLTHLHELTRDGDRHRLGLSWLRLTEGAAGSLTGRRCSVGQELSGLTGRRSGDALRNTLYFLSLSTRAADTQNLEKAPAASE
eukprot:ctg_2947.g596